MTSINDNSYDEIVKERGKRNKKDGFDEKPQLY